MIRRLLKGSQLRTFQLLKHSQHKMSSYGTTMNQDEDLQGEVIRSFLALETLDPNIFR